MHTTFPNGGLLAVARQPRHPRTSTTSPRHNNDVTQRHQYLPSITSLPRRRGFKTSRVAVSKHPCEADIAIDFLPGRESCRALTHGSYGQDLGSHETLEMKRENEFGTTVQTWRWTTCDGLQERIGRSTYFRQVRSTHRQFDKVLRVKHVRSHSHL